SSGDLFVGCCTNGVVPGAIYEFTPNGNRTTFASGLDLLRNPYGLAFNSSGDLFDADYGSDVILEFMPNGTSSPFGIPGYPTSLAFNRSGDLFEADYVSGNIYAYTPNGSRTTFASGLSAPVGVAFNSSGDLFVTVDSPGYIYKFTPNGSRTTFASGLYGAYT